MRNPLNRLAFTALLIAAGSGRSHAQAPQAPPARLAFHVEGMTVEERDAIARELNDEGAYRIAFACVPAGILVIERADGPEGGPAPASGNGILRDHIGNGRAQVDLRTMEELENECLNARSR